MKGAREDWASTQGKASQKVSQEGSKHSSNCKWSPVAFLVLLLKTTGLIQLAWLNLVQITCESKWKNNKISCIHPRPVLKGVVAPKELTLAQFNQIQHLWDGGDLLFPYFDVTRPTSQNFVFIAARF